MLSKALRDAARYNQVVKNVATEEGAPKVSTKEMVILTEDQIGQVLRHFESRPSLHPIVALALATGARRGELLALRRQDINLSAGQVRIGRALEQTRGSIRIKEPKTPHSRRTIAIPPWMMAELRAHMARQQENRLKLGQGRAPDDALLFPRWDGAIRSPYSLTQKFRQAMKNRTSCRFRMFQAILFSSVSSFPWSVFNFRPLRARAVRSLNVSLLSSSQILLLVRL